MEGKIQKVKEAVVDLLNSYEDVSDITIYIDEDLSGKKTVTVSVDVMAKLANNYDKE